MLGAVFSSQEEGSDHRHLIQLQQKLWSAPTDAKNTAAAHGAHSVSDMLDTPSTLPDNSTEFVAECVAFLLLKFREVFLSRNWCVLLAIAVLDNVY